ncbi:MAG: hypothetical protein L3K07_01870 [Thermoplasmata archaeon]|nr:hypothetical protein [Thermoplasmata archaeon]
MPASAEAAPAGSSGLPSPATEGQPGSGASGPVAVVWCRQVDNEAESPGYTTVPDDFPGRRETLEVIRLVGNLTINVADTQDYWTPGPPAPLSYYPNLFLYPAFGGRYTCVGRMFLSTEDRPRLGMKTLVLDTSQLLATGEFGPALLRWHATMAGARREGTRPPPVPDPRLFPLLGEGFLFQRGSTDPVLVVASADWDQAMEGIFELVRSMPASLLMLGAILAFPYFLPQAKTNLHEFCEQLPLALALMRIPALEATGDRLKKRMQSWESAPVTLRNLLDGIPEPSGKGKDTVPLVLQLVRDQNASRLGPIAQRVDLVELPKLRGMLADPERQGGKERRKEMWRIGTAMESAALLLQRARGRHVPVSVETAKRAQSYLQARLPAKGGELEADAESAVVAPETNGAVAATGTTAPTSAHPPWLIKSAPLPLARSPPEVVPVSRSDDPSTLPSARPPSPPSERAHAPGPILPSGVPSPVSAPQLPPADLRREIEATVNRLLELREADAVSRLLPRLAPELLARAQSESDARNEARMKSVLEVEESRLSSAIRELESRWQAKLAAPSTVSPELVKAIIELADARVSVQSTELTGRFSQRLGETESRLTQQSTALLASTESRLRESLVSALGVEVDRRAKALLERELALSQKGEPAGKITEATRAAVSAQLAAALTKSQQELEAKWEEKLRQAAGSTPLSGKALEAVNALIDQRANEVNVATQRARDELRTAVLTQAEAQRAVATAQLEEELLQAMAKEMDVRSEELARLRDKVLERFQEGDGRRLQEARAAEERSQAMFETRVRELGTKAATSLKESEGRLRALLDERAATQENRLKEELDGRIQALRDLQGHADADLQVRLQGYIDQKLREATEAHREMVVNLLARMKGEVVESSRDRGIDATRLEPLLRERFQRAADTLRSDLLLTVERKMGEAEDRLLHAGGERVQRLESVDRNIQDQSKELLRIEEGLRTELGDLERRIAVLSDRLVPVVRKSWLRIAELEKGGGGSSGDVDLRLSQLRRELKEELRRHDGEIADRVREIRDRMETTIAHQGKVWLTLIHQLSQLTEDRRNLAPGIPLAAAALAQELPDLEGAHEESEEEERPYRRRSRRPSRSA